MQVGPKPAYQNERGFSPGFQNVRPCVSGFIGGSIGYQYSDIRQLTQDNPNTVNSATQFLTALSKVTNDYDNTAGSGGLKAVVQLARPIPTSLASGNDCQFLFGASQGIANLFQASVLVIDNAPARIQGVARVRPIISQFSNTTSTWNLWVSGAHATLGAAIELTWIDTSLNVGFGSSVSLVGTCPAATFSAPRTSIVYGFIVDCKPILLSGNTPTSLQCNLNVDASPVHFAIAQF
jgi:hypothetical protein